MEGNHSNPAGSRRGAVPDRRLRLSVALCTCNGERYLEEQLRSILEQSRPPDEVVICDDRSNDGSMRKVRDFAQAARFPVRVVENPSRLGSTKNFEQAIRLCEGDIIVLSDQDDLWYPTRLSMVESAFLSRPSLGLVCADADLIDEDSRPLSVRYWKSCGFGEGQKKQAQRGKMLEVLLRHNIVCGAMTAFRAELRALLLPIPEIVVHDLWISLIVSIVSEIGLLPECAIQYRKHREQQIGVLYFSLRESVAKAKLIGPAEFRSVASQFAMARERVVEHYGPSKFERELRLVEAKVRHMNLRAAMPASHWRRLPAILRQAANRDYFRYSEGWKSIAKDLLL
jgi:hypothetical protein